MSRKWPVQDAKAKFSELLDTALSDGPQIVTKRGVEAAVLVPIEQWRKLERMTRPDLKELLLAPEARTEALVPPRGKHRRRAPWLWNKRVFLLDTNVVSELRRPRPNRDVIEWIADVPAEQLFVSAVTVGEIQAGIEITREQDAAKAMELEVWLDRVLASYGVLPMDAHIQGVGKAHAPKVGYDHRGRHDRSDGQSSQVNGGHPERARLSSAWCRVAQPFRKRIANASTGSDLAEEE